MGLPAVFILGAFSTKFGRHSELSFRDLSARALTGALSDTGLDPDRFVDSVWFGCTGTGGWPRTVNFGQMCLFPLVELGYLKPHTPIYNVENACATGSQAFNGAVKDILSGHAELSVAIGVEKVFNPSLTHQQILESFSGDEPPPGDVHAAFKEENEAAYAAARSLYPESTAGTGVRSVFMETYATQARIHMAQHGTTQAQIAAAAAKNHCYGALNDKAQYQFNMSVDDVLADRMVSHPLTRSMCAPIGDGSAAIMVCSEALLSELPKSTQERAVRVAATEFTSGHFRSADEPSLSKFAAEAAYTRAGLRPADIDVVELHDATAFCEIFQVEMLGFCKTGQGGEFVESGETGRDGSIPVNTSGGLVSKGHPIAATGLSMLCELTMQLRREAGERQVPGAKIALQENGGGVMGLEEAACHVALLTRE